MPNSRFFFLLAFAVCPPFACKQQTELTLEIEAKTNLKEPIKDADVFIDENPVGKTDHLGRFVTTKELERDKQIKITIKKESDDFYYAPYIDSFRTPDEDHSELSLKPVIYFVPKPKRAHLEKKPPLTDAPPKTPPAPKEKAPEPSKPDELASQPSSPPPEPPSKTPLLEPNPTPAIKEPPPAPSGSILTFYAYQDDKPLDGVIIESQSFLSQKIAPVCETNQRGRCIFTFPDTPPSTLAIIATKSGYQTLQMKVQPQQTQRIRLQLKKGRSLDLRASLKRFHHSLGLKGVGVFINGKSVGYTDQAGFLTVPLAEKPGELLDIQLKSSHHLPTSITHEVVLSGSLKIEQHFTPISPPKGRIGITDLLPAGNLDDPKMPQYLKGVKPHFEASLRQYLFKNSIFQRVEPSVIKKALEREAMSVSDALLEGFAHQSLDEKVDALLRPTLIISDPLSLELTLVDRNGDILAAAKETLANPDDKKAIAHIVGKLSNSLKKVFPYELAVKKISGKVLTLNGGSTTHPLKKGSEFAIFGKQPDRFGKSYKFTRIGTAVVTLLHSKEAKAKILNLVPRATVAVGDLLVLSKNKKQTASNEDPSIALKVVDLEEKKPVSQANLYTDEGWIGSTNAQGLVMIDKDQLKKDMSLKVIRHGYKEFQTTLADITPQITFQLEKSKAFLMIDTIPSGAGIYLDNRYIGKSPTRSPIETQSGFVKLRVGDLNGYKDYHQVLDLDQGTLDLRDARAISLEKDLIKEIELLSNQGEIDRALEKINEIPEDHTDYLLAHHKAGMIYLNIKRQPAKAAEHFGKVTSEKEVSSFRDKRFIASHINEGLALFETAENLVNENKELALAHYQKSQEVLAKASPFVRFMRPEEARLSQHRSSYYLALTYQKMYELTGNQDLLITARQNFRNYLRLKRPDSEDLGESDLLSQYDNAQIYLKQANQKLDSQRDSL